MPDPPLISVLLPVRNAAATLEAALRSLFAQRCAAEEAAHWLAKAGHPPLFKIYITI
ncbi:glycosyltransferase [Desulfovibrio sp. ZJ369]|uniref:glycosyltransferase n=1 Tax=Desulfovibrio sp. ZJ369 TaxID=2709793 RepID=UPI00197D8050|nr:glycosyltransferase [Desulfovibrio sp. ZJ369]